MEREKDKESERERVVEYERYVIVVCIRTSEQSVVAGIDRKRFWEPRGSADYRLI